MTWLRLLTQHLPTHARRAGVDTLAELTRALERSGPAPTLDAESAAASLRPCLELGAELAQELDLMRLRAAEHLALLAGPMTEPQRRRALAAVLEAEFPKTARADLRASARWLDAEAIEDRFALRLQRLEQQLEFLLLAAAPLALAEVERLARLDAALTQTAYAVARRVADDERCRSPVRVAALRLLGAVARSENAEAGDARQYLLGRLGALDDEPWPVAAALTETVALRHRLWLPVESVLRLALRPPSARLEPTSHGGAAPRSVFVRARAAALAGEVGEVELLAECLAQGEPSEHVSIEAARALARATRRAPLGRPRDARLEARALEVLSTLWRPDSTAPARTRAAAAIAMLPDDRAPAAAATPGELGEFGALGDLGERADFEERTPGADCVAFVARVLEAERDPWVQRVLCRALLDRRASLGGIAAPARAAWGPALARLLDEASERELALAAAHLLDWLSVVSSPQTALAHAELEAWLTRADEGERRRFETGPTSALRRDELLQVLVVLSADRFDLSATPLARGYLLHYGARARWALWRLAHELLSPAPDKRQAYSHVVDRVQDGSLIALSSRLGEVTQTRVPGQRVARQRGLYWGQELPLPSLLMAAARHGEVTVATQLGEAVVRRRGSRAGAWLRANRHYVRLAEARETALANDGPRARALYDEALGAAGFETTRRARSSAAEPPSDTSKGTGPGAPPPGVSTQEQASRALGLGVAALPELQDLLSAALRTDTSTPAHLALVAGGLAAAWGVRTLIGHQRIAHWRRSIPLVIGGWGSRGKSGTERLKAALFHGLGYRVVCKTTGCEAMMIASIPGRTPTEVFLYRPADKATIWEQRDVLRIAAKAETQVFLWECMALNPDFVSTLQHEWMRDDYTTITNAYPDHEDIQGPSGRDVAAAVSRFVPHQGTAFTTEQQMAPLLEARARKVGADLRLCREETWELLPEDLLRRFPYAEHPRNIALVLDLARELGVPSDLALHEMAAHVVPDVGVLREYGPMTTGRDAAVSLSFINGMSANERAGFTSNWERLGLGAFGDESGLTERLVVLVNNRADRPARAREFVALMLEQSSADELVVVGTDVRGFTRSYEKGLGRVLRPALLATARADGPRAVAARLAERLRRRPLPREGAKELLLSLTEGTTPTSEPGAASRPSVPSREDGVARMRAASERRASLGPFTAPPRAALLALVDEAYDRARDPDAASRTLAAEAAALHAATRTATDPTARWRAHARLWLAETSWLDALTTSGAFDVDLALTALVELLRGRLSALSDPAIPADALLDALSRSAPPESHTRVLGCANIKGPGLRFVTRWLSLDAVERLVAALDAADNPRAGELLDKLAALREAGDWGPLERRLVTRRLDTLLASGRLALLGLSGAATTLRDSLAAELRGSSAASGSGLLATSAGNLRRLAESHGDLLDGARRRKHADDLADDLAEHRVGLQRAATVAKALTERQKGGWLRGRKG